MSKKILSALLALCMALTLAPLLAFADSGKAADGPKVTINVKDGDNAAVEGATVKLTKDANTPYTLTADTEIKGSYYVYDVGADTYTYSVTLEGYMEATGDIAVTDQGATKDVTLVKLPVAGSGTTVTPGEDGSSTAKDSGNNVVLSTPSSLANALDGTTITVANKTGGFSEVKNANLNPSSGVTLDDVKSVIASAAAGASVTIAKDSQNITSFDQTITITIKVAKAGTYHVFCISDAGVVTSFGEQTVTGTTVTIKTKHLCEFPVVEVTDENKDAVAAVAAALGMDSGAGEGNPGTTPEAPAPSDPSAPKGTWTTEMKVGVSDGTVVFTNLDASTQYIVEINFNGTKAYVNMTSNADGTMNVGCQKGAVVQLRSMTDGKAVCGAVQTN